MPRIQSMTWSGNLHQKAPRYSTLRFKMVKRKFTDKAIAILYNENESAAPKVVASGQGIIVLVSHCVAPFVCVDTYERIHKTY